MSRYDEMIREAQLYEKIGGDRVHCHLCSHYCRIDKGVRGLCGVRENRGGMLQSLVYGAVISEHADPIEKKPLFHVYPGSTAYSLATMGCNFRCDFCQNYQISQAPREGRAIAGHDMTPAAIVEQAIACGSPTIAYTYTEPTIYFEFAYDTARLAHARGLKNVFVTNGYMTVEAIEMIAPFLDAANVDLKSGREEVYSAHCGGQLQPVLKSLRKLKELGIWVEVTTLVVPALNDQPEELERIASFVHSLGAETPWHISRFYPRYKMTGKSPTSGETLRRARHIGKRTGLKYVYGGSSSGDDGENTYCCGCGKLLIARQGFYTRKLTLKKNVCPDCGTILEGIF